MELVYVTSAKIPSRAANAVQSLKMCDAFVGAGARVRMIARAGDDGDVFADYALRNRFAIEHHALRGPRGFRTALLEWDFRRAARRAPRADAFFSRDVFALCSLASTGRPMVLELHRTMDLHRAERVALRWLSTRTNLVAVVVVSRGMADWYATRFPALRLVVEPGAAEEREPLRSGRRGSVGPFTVGYVGHLYPGRGVEVIRALALGLPDVQFHVVGGTDKDVRRCREAMIATNLVFHGHVPHARVPSLIGAFDVLLAPYQRRVMVEGGAETSAVMSPLKLFEYMSYGLPIVCSDLPVLREVLDDEVAVLVPPDDLAAWQTAVARLRDDGAHRRELGAAAHARFSARHTWNARARRILTLLHGAV